ncbi:MAG: thioredoxin domain-containing protein [candidate division Zixibacteria bacterium]|nr:thioredoxin domain-containing protein [candidate division Zixibacteria bacterium]
MTTNITSQDSTNKGNVHFNTPPQVDLKKIPQDGGDRWNRLVFEQSPYLLQHAANPVDWYPWGESAFYRARSEDKPIFLSIGYSTCHWCHVMERESFEDAKVAKLLNDNFVCIKVDREERPDIDNIYMNVCQLMTGSGGWPLTVILTPDLKPFFAGTYFPKESVYGRIGMMQLIPAISNAWKSERGKVLESTTKIMSALKQNSVSDSGDELMVTVMKKAFDQFHGRYDEDYGGFGKAPKFPTPHNFLFLLRYWKRSGDESALQIVEKTLKQMRLGGIYDHIGYGFHRYSTDRQWLLPHFEKMLYDQALLATAYLETYQATGDRFYSRTAEEIFEYVMREMSSPEGGFYSAEDADSEGEEGKFYVWETSELMKILGEEDGKLFIEVFNITEDGNFSEQSTGEKTGVSIPHLKKSIPELAVENEYDSEELLEKLSEIRGKLFDAREKRIHPYKDDKILTDWNGLMIAAFAAGARVLKNDNYANFAKKTADFILEKMITKDGHLYHRYRAGQPGINGMLDDYSFMIHGLIELYQTTFDVKYLRKAIELNDKMIRKFWDSESGGFFLSGDDADDLIIRAKDIYDGALPSGNSIALLNLIRLSRITANNGYEIKARELLKAFSKEVDNNPSAYSQLLAGLDYLIGPSLEIVIVGNPDSKDTFKMKNALNESYFPNKIVILRPGGERPPITEIAGYTLYQNQIDSKATAYVCRNFVCDKPTTDVSKLVDALRR